MELFFLLLAIALPILFIEFLYFLYHGRTWLAKPVSIFIDITFFILTPIMFFSFVDKGNEIQCCEESVVFAPAHRLSVYTVYLLVSIAYFANKYLTIQLPPLLNILTLLGILTGVVFNIAMTIHLRAISLLGNVPLLFLLLQQLYFSHCKTVVYFKNLLQQENQTIHPSFYQLLFGTSLKKYSLLLFLCIPFVTILDGFLIIWGQRPDSIVRAFTDTYYHGLSQLTAQCDNINCGGHYLCSVAANGSNKIVKPIRLGVRNGNWIVCNRQLLIANAFEQLLQNNFPRLHKKIRKNYDKVGNMIHKNYNFYNSKLASNTIYYFMKPLEWLFIIVLYTFDKNPETRIEKQYTNFKN